MSACEWCHARIPLTLRADARFCSRKCRQTAFRLRTRIRLDELAAAPMVVAYADPPYPGRAAKYYGSEPSFAGEVDHVALIAVLSKYQAWALSTSADALREVLPLCPPSARVCSWVKPIGASPRTRGLHNTWEPLIVVGGRAMQPGVRDWLSAKPARNGGELPGRKPIAFCAWLFRCLGMLPGDELRDLFPGTGVVSRAWAEASRTTSRDSRRRQRQIRPRRRPATRRAELSTTRDTRPSATRRRGGPRATRSRSTSTTRALVEEASSIN